MNEDEVTLEELSGPMDGQQTLNKGTDEEVVCFGYTPSPCRTALYFLSVPFSLGFALLLFYWRPEWKLWFKCSRSASLENSKYVLLRDVYGRYSVAKVESHPAGYFIHLQ